MPGTSRSEGENGIASLPRQWVGQTYKEVLSGEGAREKSAALIKRGGLLVDETADQILGSHRIMAIWPSAALSLLCRSS